MEKLYIGVDLGSTNIKVALYDHTFQLRSSLSTPVKYIRTGGVVEFDAKAYCENLVDMMRKLMADNQQDALQSISFTGQAESLVCVGADGMPLMNAISWMDERSGEECKILSRQFTSEQVREKTGQMEICPTWPATKILWLKENAPQVYKNTETYMLLKDYVVFWLTGKKLGDMSIATFSLYFDIYNKCYWQEMLAAIGISEKQLPGLTEPCTVAGPLLPTVAQQIGAGRETVVNIGTLDHFAAMVGTGNIGPGGINLSMGTVMALATMAPDRAALGENVAVHYGFLPDTYVLLPVASSGGVSLEWFRRTCMPQVDYGELNRVLADRDDCGQVLFLPYLVSGNAPEFDADATGVFWGLRQNHDAFDMARAVMEGVAFLLRKNCQSLKEANLPCESILAVGGGTKSEIWCQMWADVTGIPVKIPAEQEAACLGAAMIGAVADGHFADYAEAVAACVEIRAEYKPRKGAYYEEKYRRFCALYRAALNI
ncbi:MAG: hypothetical protein E7447_07715 [Ruminococcaceae bacterium]|nr:hypothetical protein [Oscillospiraceae bacterium]